MVSIVVEVAGGEPGSGYFLQRRRVGATPRLKGGLEFSAIFGLYHRLFHYNGQYSMNRTCRRAQTARHRPGLQLLPVGFHYPALTATILQSVDVVRLSNAGKLDAAQDLFDTCLPLMRYEQQPGLGLAVRKYVLAKRGAIASAAQRRPGMALNTAAVREVERLIEPRERRLPELK